MEKLMSALILLIIFNSIPTTDSNHMLHTMQEEEYDGPYVHYNNNYVFIDYILEANGSISLKRDSVAIRQKNDISLKVKTDIPGTSFLVHLKKELKKEKSEFQGVKNMVVLSDIEGNFGALRKLLLSTNVIDENLNWKLGNGHLVLVGDFFDRGEQVTEILWFIYSLEEKARTSGGYVHFILGNHEIMNLSGDLRYVHQKYLNAAGLLHRNYVSLYDEHSELGRWLRTKNIIERIGNIVFVHGGISADINSMLVSIPDINRLAQPYYADSIFSYPDVRSDIIMGDLGPFWYRGYYDRNNARESMQIDSTLSQFNAHHIVTGHTIVSDTISVWYNGKLLNTDVHHAGGKSEALLIENDKFYRVNASGKKVLLMEATSHKS